MAIPTSADLDSLLMELRQTYIGMPQQQQARPITPPVLQQQPMQPQPMMQMQTPQLPQAAPLQPMFKPPMTAALNGLRPGFQANPMAPEMPEGAAAQTPVNSPLLAQRLASFMNSPQSGPADIMRTGQTGTPTATEPSLGQRLGNVAYNAATSEAGAQGIANLAKAAAPLASGAATWAAGKAAPLAGRAAAPLWGLAAANPAISIPLAVAGVAGLGYYGYKKYNQQQQPAPAPVT